MLKITWYFVLAVLSLCLPACGGGGGGSGGGTIEIRGRVVGKEGAPRAFVPVAVLGHPLEVTDLDGKFRIAGIRAPYEIAVFDPSGAQVTIYQELTRTDPTLVLYLESNAHRAEILGQSTGGLGYPLPANHRALVWATGPLGLSGIARINSTTGDYISFDDLSWAGFGGSIPVTLHALQYSHDAGNNPIDFKSYGVLNTNINVTTNSNRDVAMSMDPGTMSLSGTYVAAPGTQFDYATAIIDTSPTTSVPIFYGPTSTPGAFQVRSPILPGATYTAEVRTEAQGGVYSIARAAGLAPYTNDLVLDTPSLHLVTGPPANFMDASYDTEFTFDASHLGLHMVHMSTGFGTEHRPSFAVITTGTTVAMPDMRAYGYPLPSSTGYTWAVHAWGPFDSVDEMAGVGSLWANAPVAYHTRSQVFEFTTAP